MGQLQASDFRVLLVVVIVMAAFLAVVWRVLARRGVSLREMLTPAEWKLFFKLIAIAVIAVVLLQAKISLEFPAAQFIYGRF